MSAPPTSPPAPRPERARIRDFGRLLTGAFLALLVLIVAIVVSGILVSRDINDSSTERFVQDAIPLKAAVQDLALQMVTQQSSVRAYVITGRQGALDTYNTARVAATSDLAYIGGHLAGHPIMAGLVARAMPQIDRLEDSFARQIALVRTGPAGVAQVRRQITLGQTGFRPFRVTSNLMIRDTDRFVREAGRSQANRTDGLTVLLAVGGVAAVGLVALLGWAVYRRTSKLFRAAETDRAAAEESRAFLDTLVAEAPDGIAIFDRDLRYLRVNGALAAINGVAPEDHAGRTVAEIVPGVSEEGHVAPLRRVLETGLPVADLEVSGHTPADPGRLHHWLVSYFPIRPERMPAGSIVALGAFVVDITERKAFEARLALLSEASDVLGAALGVEERLDRLMRLLVPRLADFATVEVADPDGGQRRLAAAHVDPAADHALQGLPPGGPAGERSVLLAHVTEPQLDWLIADPADLAGLRDLNPRSMLVLPLIARGRTLGRLLLATSTSGRSYDEDDLHLAEEVAQRAAVALDNARLYEAQREIAHTLQQSLLPPVLPAIGGVEVAARYHSVGTGIEVGGDFYDLFEMSEETWAVVIGDVCGKGPRAAELTALARYTIRAAGVREKSPGAILATLNEAVVRQRGDSRFLTAVCACMQVSEVGVRLVVACAGHPPPLILRRDGRVERTALRGPLVGIYGAIELPDEVVDLAPGDALLLYTDGVTEARGEGGFLDMAGLERELAACAGGDAEHVAGRLERAVLDLQGGRPRDDVAIVVVRAAGVPAAGAAAGGRSQPDAART